MIALRLPLMVLCSLLVGCWVDFPHSRYGRDGGDGDGLSRDGAAADHTPCETSPCCFDRDEDGFSTCAGDCDDGDPQVRPDQVSFFEAPAAGGGFDYNCDGREEQRYPEKATTCVRSGGECVGEGWAGAIPQCGAAGVFNGCVEKALACVQQPQTRVQPCR